MPIDSKYLERLTSSHRIFFIVPAPSPHEISLATEAAGATVSVSSNFWAQDWGTGQFAQQKLLNVLRVTGRFEPGGDSSFIFSDRQSGSTWARALPPSWLLVDLGNVQSLTRVGTVHWSDRSLSWLKIESALSIHPAEDARAPKLLDGRTLWGEQRHGMRDTSAKWFDREPTDARYILFSVSSGYMQGARLGPIFVYGPKVWWSPETHVSFPARARGIVRLMMLCVARKASGRTTPSECLVGKLGAPIWCRIFSFLARHDFAQK